MVHCSRRGFGAQGFSQFRHGSSPPAALSIVNAPLDLTRKRRRPAELIARRAAIHHNL